MRNDFIVSYDISDPVRLRKVFQVMRGYGDPLQYSVFRCALTKQERVKLEAALSEHIHQTEDQVLFVNLGPTGRIANKRFATLGRSMVHPERHATVV